jgi:hypothetical protein
MEAQLAQIQSMLGPDGYELEWRSSGDDSIELEVVAGPDACAECLVPKKVMLGIVNSMLAEVGVTVSGLVYPTDGGPAH